MNINEDYGNIELETSLKLIVKTSFIVFVGLILSKIFTYSYKIIIARWFGPEVYGLFSLASMILVLFIVFSSFGLPEGLLRYIPLYRGKKETNKIRHILRFSLTLLFFSSLVSAIVLFFLSDFISLNVFHNQSLIIFLKWFSFLIPFYIFLNIFLSVFRAYEKISTNSFIINILQPALSLILIIFLIFIGLDSKSVIFSYAISILIVFLASLLICKYKIPEAFRKPYLNNQVKKKVIKDLISYSWPLIFLTLLSNLFGWIASFMLGYFKGASDVGFYNVATTFSNLFNIVPLILLSLFYPLATREFSRKKIKVVKELSQQIVKWIFIINLPVSILFILFPGAIINVFFGSEYLVAENSLRILSIGSLFLSSLLISNDLLSMKGKSKLLLINIISLSMLNFILNLILIPRYGINGAAISSTISCVALSLLLVLEVKHYLSIIPLKKGLFKILLISIIPILSLLYLKRLFPSNLLSIIMQGILFFLFYLLLILLTGCLDKNDLFIIRAIKNKLAMKKEELS